MSGGWQRAAGCTCSKPKPALLCCALRHVGSEEYSGIIPDLWPQAGTAACICTAACNVALLLRLLTLLRLPWNVWHGRVARPKPQVPAMIHPLRPIVFACCSCPTRCRGTWGALPCSLGRLCW